MNNLRALRVEPTPTTPNLIGGFSGNSVLPGAFGATIAGGGEAGEINRVNANFGTVSGGHGNTVYKIGGSVAGGSFNTASGNYAVVSGGSQNVASSFFATVSGGWANMVTAQHGAIGGGWQNLASGEFSTVSGGRRNEATGDHSTVNGGWLNMATGDHSSVGGGFHNLASGYLSTVGGGYRSIASGDYSFVVGRRARNMDASHNGVFMFADSTNGDFFSTAADQFNVRASGGYRLFSNAELTAGVALAAGSGSWSSVSDRNIKANFGIVDKVQLLDALAGMPVFTWNMQAQSEDVRHIGPVAQDFHASFGYLFGGVESPLHINTMDALGVSLAASQGLYTLVQDQAEQIGRLQDEVGHLQARLEALERRVQGHP